MKFNIMKTMHKIPSGLLIIPLLISAVFNTLFPTFWTTLGGPSEGLFKSGTYCVIGLMLFSSGATVSFKKIGKILKYGATYAIFKLLIIFGVGTLFLRFFGADGIWGISAFAFIPAICYMNPGLFISLAQQYGEPEDLGMMLLPQLFCMSVWSILVFNLSGGSDAVNWMSAINVLIPFFLGMLLGNLDPEFIKFIKPASTICLVLMGFVFGAAINLKTAFHAGIRGIVLALVIFAINLVFMYFLADKVILKRPGWVGAGLCATTGVACVDPSLMAAGNEAYIGYIPEAVSLLALTFLITTLISAVMCRMISNKSKSPEAAEPKQAA